MKLKATTVSIVLLSTFLLVSVSLNVLGWWQFKSWESLVIGAELQNIKYRTRHLVEIRSHLQRGSVSDAEIVLNKLKIAEVALLDGRQLPQNSESVRSHASKLQTDFEQAWMATEKRR